MSAASSDCVPVNLPYIFLCPPVSILPLACDPHVTTLIPTGKGVPMPEGQGGGGDLGQIDNRRPKDNILVILIIAPRDYPSRHMSRFVKKL